MLAADEGAVVFVICVAIAAVIIIFLRHGYAERMQRLRVLEEALRDPRLDAATRQQLLTALQAPQGLPGTWRAWFRDNLTPRRVFTSAAWMSILVGCLMMVLGSRWEFPAGVTFTAIGVAILALPIVIRELEGRAARR